MYIGFFGGKSLVQTRVCFSCNGKTPLFQPVSCWRPCSAFPGLLHIAPFVGLVISASAEDLKFVVRIYTNTFRMIQVLKVGWLVHRQRYSQSHRNLEIAFWKMLIKSVGEGQKGGNANMCNNTNLCFFLYSAEMSRLLPKILLRSNSTSSSLVDFHTCHSTRYVVFHLTLSVLKWSVCCKVM